MMPACLQAEMTRSGFACINRRCIRPYSIDLVAVPDAVVARLSTCLKKVLFGVATLPVHLKVMIGTRDSLYVRQSVYPSRMIPFSFSMPGLSMLTAACGA